MTRVTIQVPLSQSTRAIEALTGVSKHADFAQRSAMRAAARKGRTQVVRAVAGQIGVPQKLVRKAIRFYLLRQKREHTTAGKLWVGLKSGLKERDHPNVAKKLRVQQPQAFQARMRSGHVGLFERTRPTRPVGPGARLRPRERGALPIQEQTLKLDPPAGRLMEGVGRAVMTTIYPEVLRRDFLRRIRRASARRR